MSSNPMAWEGGINPRVEQFPKSQGCLMPMGVTSENVAAAFGIDRCATAAAAVVAFDGRGAIACVSATAAAAAAGLPSAINPF